MRKLLDLFCGAGGASMGYHRAGFDVTGIDIKPQKNYPFQFIQGDALNPPVDLTKFDVIHASPPCQAYSSCTPMEAKKAHPALIPQIRAMLEGTGKPFVIENVISAPLKRSAVLCGTMFNLKDELENIYLRRHRAFESNVLLMSFGGCRCDTVETAFVSGHMGKLNRHPSHGTKAGNENASKMMGIDWMKRDEIIEAIPPAYTEFIGKQLLRSLEC
jgi:DNA (cytosine-5)-methyltransferase 1